MYARDRDNMKRENVDNGGGEDTRHIYKGYRGIEAKQENKIIHSNSKAAILVTLRILRAGATLKPWSSVR
ncbi:MAG: hypothetical protein NWF07_11755 [Candidatus Bathyarchaeota archaeon]|nr:hypothetical protein [Candidatus Bathyarchaeota archaeon]